MDKVDIDEPLNQAQEQLQVQFSSGLYWTLCLVRWLGYGFLVLTLLDTIHAVVPPRFMEAAWEFQTIGNFVERVPIPLLGLVMAFAGNKFGRSQWENNLLKLLSWLALLFGVMYLLMIPLGIFDTLRLDRQNQEQINAKVEQRIEQIQRFQQSQIPEMTRAIKAQAKEMEAFQHFELLKNSIKWNLEALISGCLFLLIWQSTRGWTRLTLRRRY